MAQRLKTDWILFFTIVAMVCFGLVIVYSASSVMAELKYKWDMYFIARQIGWATVSFLMLMQLKRLDYRRFDNPIWAFAPLGVVTSLLVLVYFIGREASLAASRNLLAAAFRVRQARADHLSRVLHLHKAAGDQ